MKKNQSHIVQSIRPGSAAEGTSVSPGDELIRVNGEEVADIFDYQYLTTDTELELVLRDESGRLKTVCMEKEEDEDPGLVFAEGLMDEYRSCRNRCIFCFIDQMPKGMRPTLYFKDDDSRLSFLQGNYVTLTNLSEEDVDRIIRYRLDPVNISFHATDPELRCRMMGNRFAGEALEKARRLKEAGIHMNGQIVLCKGINDGAQLEKSILDLSGYLPELMSLSVVPAGLTRFRDGLYPLEAFTAEDAGDVVRTVEKWQERLYRGKGSHFVHASDEWYMLLGRPVPEEESYDGYLQLENGVGMIRLMLEEFEDGIKSLRRSKKKREFSLATGELAYPVIWGMTQRMREVYPNMTVHCHKIRNDFFGARITVSGLITGQDLLKQLKGQPLGEALYLPENMLRAGEEVFLDDMTVSGLAESLQVKIHIVKSDGISFIRMYR
ncbi:MAG: DUF512 domain-containing protein [Lachnospiraceae bacterium]|nr:DUF512 domain-containing protein [Lachnospiraceae bacterium]